MPLTKDHKYDVEAIAKSIHDNTKSSTSQTQTTQPEAITKKEFDHLMGFVPNHVLVILDEAYFEFAQKKMTTLTLWIIAMTMLLLFGHFQSLRTIRRKGWLWICSRLNRKPLKGKTSLRAKPCWTTWSRWCGK